MRRATPPCTQDVALASPIMPTVRLCDNLRSKVSVTHLAGRWSSSASVPLPKGSPEGDVAAFGEFLCQVRQVLGAGLSVKCTFP